MTLSQIKATAFLTGKGWVSAYDIKRSCGVTRVTLAGLVRRGVLESKHGLGTIAFPSTIEYRLLDEGGEEKV